MLADKHALAARLAQQADEASRRAEAVSGTADELRQALDRQRRETEAAQAGEAAARADANRAQQQVIL